MTEAYLNGFMKEAAAAGVDPDALVKAAINFGAIANGAGRLVGSEKLEKPRTQRTRADFNRTGRC